MQSQHNEVILEDGKYDHHCNCDIVRKLVNMAFKRALVVFVLFSTFYAFIMCETDEEEKEKTKIGKDVLDYTESDIYRLAEQWDVSRSIIII